jgi:DNA replication protein DnaC
VPHRERRAEAESRRELAGVVGRYARTVLVVLDEVGCLALCEGAAELVFQVISERNERGTLIVATNLPFDEWTKVFPRPQAREGGRRPDDRQGVHHRHRADQSSTTEPGARSDLLPAPA